MADTKQFLDRFNRWKNGAPIQELYKAGRPVKFDDGKDVNKEPKEDPALRASLEYALALKLDRYNEGKDTEEPKAVAGGYNFNAIHKVAQNAPLSYGSYYDLTGDVNMDNRLPKYGDGKSNADRTDTFVQQMSPLVYREILNAGIANPDRVHDYMMRQLAWESTYGTSNVARRQHNYGGVGWNGKTYFTYKTDEDFVKDYVSLMNRRYKEALAADTIQGYGAALKKRGYYEDTLEHYTSNLANMKSLSRSVAAHKKANPDLYIPQSIARPKSTNAPIVKSLPQNVDQFTPRPVYIQNSAATPSQMEYDPSIPASINKDTGVATWPRYTVLPDIKELSDAILNDKLPLQQPLRQWIAQ